MPSAEPSLGVHTLAHLRVPPSATPASNAAPGMFWSLFSYSEQLSIAQVNMLGGAGLGNRCPKESLPLGQSRPPCTLTFTHTLQHTHCKEACPREAPGPLHTHTSPRQGLPHSLRAPGLFLEQGSKDCLPSGKIQGLWPSDSGGRQYC